MEILRINNLRIWANHGWFPEEQCIGSEYQLDIRIESSTADIADDLESVVDYQKVVEICKSIMQINHRLIEDLTKKISMEIKTNFSIIKKVEVTVTKLRIPINGLESTSFTHVSI